MCNGRRVNYHLLCLIQVEKWWQTNYQNHYSNYLQDLRCSITHQLVYYVTTTCGSQSTITPLLLLTMWLHCINDETTSLFYGYTQFQCIFHRRTFVYAVVHPSWILPITSYLHRKYIMLVQMKHWNVAVEFRTSSNSPLTVKYLPTYILPVVFESAGLPLPLNCIIKVKCSWKRGKSVRISISWGKSCMRWLNAWW